MSQIGFGECCQRNERFHVKVARRLLREEARACTCLPRGCAVGGCRGLQARLRIEASKAGQRVQRSQVGRHLFEHGLAVAQAQVLNCGFGCNHDAGVMP